MGASVVLIILFFVVACGLWLLVVGWAYQDSERGKQERERKRKGKGRP